MVGGGTSASRNDDIVEGLKVVAGRPKVFPNLAFDPITNHGLFRHLLRYGDPKPGIGARTLCPKEHRKIIGASLVAIENGAVIATAENAQLAGKPMARGF